MIRTNTARVKGSDLELKEKVVAINRVVKTTKGTTEESIIYDLQDRFKNSTGEMEKVSFRLLNS